MKQTVATHPSSISTLFSLYYLKNNSFKIKFILTETMHHIYKKGMYMGKIPWDRRKYIILSLEARRKKTGKLFSVARKKNYVTGDADNFYVKLWKEMENIFCYANTVHRFRRFFLLFFGAGSGDGSIFSYKLYWDIKYSEFFFK